MDLLLSRSDDRSVHSQEENEKQYRVHCIKRLLFIQHMLLDIMSTKNKCRKSGNSRSGGNNNVCQRSKVQWNKSL